MSYGLPYMGSKSKLVKSIVPLFPPADNFVDLFAGGGAVTHYAMTTAKYKHFVFNDINPLMPKAFGMALNGEFENEKRWISREEFFRLRDTDPYVAICFSFGNNLSDYMYSKDIEPIKEAYHYALFFGDYSLAKERMGIDFTPLDKCPTIKEKYAMLKNIVKNTPPYQWKQGCSQWRIWNVSIGAVSNRECGEDVAVQKSPLQYRDTMQTGAKNSPCLTLSSSTAATTNPCRYPIIASSTATFRTRTPEHINGTKRRSSTTSASMTGRTDRHSRHLSASIGCPRIGLGALRKLKELILCPLPTTQKRSLKEYLYRYTNKRKYINN